MARQRDLTSNGRRLLEACANCQHTWGHHALLAPYKCCIQDCGCREFREASDTRSCPMLFRAQLNAANLEIERQRAEIVDGRALILSLFDQACFIGEKYNHSFISAYEEDQEKLIAWGLIKAADCYYERKDLAAAEEKGQVEK